MSEISALQLRIAELAERLVTLCNSRGIPFGTAESCTGGGIAAAVTEISGASASYYGSIVSYDNSVKEQLLGVQRETLATRGAVSSKAATEMAEGALKALHVKLSVAVTGIAGPTGGTPEKPVGLVYIAVGREGKLTLCRKNFFSGDRHEIRLRTVEAALSMMLFAVENG